ncbi:MAG: uracil-DNA glycosylase [Ghiorsea sp.]
MQISNLLDSSWLSHLAEEFEKPYMKTLQVYLKQRESLGIKIYPEENQYFTALNTSPLQAVKVVILGQDPYHGENQAHGLSFSVPLSQRTPPSLRNIYKELQRDLNILPPTHGNLVTWAEQGVLLLNSVLTVEAGHAGAHQGKGWEIFTNEVIATINRERESVVFMLWGSYAQKKGSCIDRDKHLVLESSHPSPLSAHRGFLGCKHFSKANVYLQQKGDVPINWNLPSHELF